MDAETTLDDVQELMHTAGLFKTLGFAGGFTDLFDFRGNKRAAGLAAMKAKLQAGDPKATAAYEQLEGYTSKGIGAAIGTFVPIPFVGTVAGFAYGKKVLEWVGFALEAAGMGNPFEKGYVGRFLTGDDNFRIAAVNAGAAGAPKPKGEEPTATPPQPGAEPKAEPGKTVNMSDTFGPKACEGLDGTINADPDSDGLLCTFSNAQDAEKVKAWIEATRNLPGANDPDGTENQNTVNAPAR